MALRFNASGDIVYRTARLPLHDAFTVAGWVDFPVAPGSTGYRFIFALENTVYPADSTAWALLGFRDAFDQWYLSNTSSDALSGITPGAGRWYIVLQASGATDTRGYVLSPAGVLTTWTSGGKGAFTVATVAFGSDTFDEFINCRLQQVRVWDAVLSQNEILQEAFSNRPKRKQNLHAWYPMHLGDPRRFMDYSGNGRHLTVGGSVLDEADFAPLTPLGIRPQFWPQAGVGVASGTGNNLGGGFSHVVAPPPNGLRGAQFLSSSR